MWTRMFQAYPTEMDGWKLKELHARHFKWGWMTLNKNEFQYQDSMQSEKKKLFQIEDKLESFIFIYMKNWRRKSHKKKERRGNEWVRKYIKYYVCVSIFKLWCLLYFIALIYTHNTHILPFLRALLMLWWKILFQNHEFMWVDFGWLSK